MPIVALAAVDVVWIAIAAMLLIFAAAYFVNWLANMVPDWNLPGFTSIRSWVINTSATVERSLAHWLHSAIGSMTNIMTWPVINAMNLWDKSIGGLSAIQGVLKWIVTSGFGYVLAQAVYYVNYAYAQALNAIAGALAEANAYTQSIGGYILTQAGSFVGALRTELTTEISSLAGTVETDYQNAIGFTQAMGSYVLQTVSDALQSVEGRLSAAIGDLTAFTVQSVQTLEADVDAALATAESFAATVATDAAANAIKAVDIDVAAVMQVVWPAITDEVTAIQGIIATDFPDVSALWDAIPKSIPLSQVTAIAGLGALAIPIARFLKDCGLPMCNNLHAFGNIINDLGALLDGGALVALLAAAASDPSGTAGAIESAAGDIISSTASTFRSMIGV